MEHVKGATVQGTEPITRVHEVQNEYCGDRSRY